MSAKKERDSFFTRGERDRVRVCSRQSVGIVPRWREVIHDREVGGGVLLPLRISYEFLMKFLTTLHFACAENYGKDRPSWRVILASRHLDGVPTLITIVRLYM